MSYPRTNDGPPLEVEEATSRSDHENDGGSRVVYLVWHDDFPEDTYLVAVCGSKERAERMLAEDARANEIQEWELDVPDGGHLE